MKQFAFLEFFPLFKNFGATVKAAKIPLLIFVPLSFVYLIALQALLFVKHIIECLFGHIPNAKDEHIAYRVAGLLVFWSLLTAKFLLLGALDAVIYILAFFYDLTNKIMSLGTSESFFLDM